MIRRRTREKILLRALDIIESRGSVGLFYLSFLSIRIHEHLDRP